MLAFIHQNLSMMHGAHGTTDKIKVKGAYLPETFFCCCLMVTMAGCSGKLVSSTVMDAGLPASSSACKHSAAWPSKPSRALQMAGPFLKAHTLFSDRCKL